jgi:hypothetical protein
MPGVWIGPIPFGVSAVQVALVRNLASMLEVFYIDAQGQLWHNWETAQNSLTWATPVMFPGLKVKQIAVGMNWDGRLEIFYTDPKNYLYHDWQLTPLSGTDSASIQWSGQTPFPQSGPQESARLVTVGKNLDGRLEIFYVGTNGQLYHNWQLTPASYRASASLNSWQGETAFPAKGSPKNKAQYIAVGQNQDGRLEIFYVGANNRLHHNWQTQPANQPAGAPLNSWAGESSFPVKGSHKDSAKQIAVGLNAAGRLEIFYVGTDNHLFHNWQVTVPNWQDVSTVNMWAGEDRLMTAKNVTQIAVASDQDALLELMYIGSDKQLYHNAQITAATGLAPQPPGDWQGELLLASAGVKAVCMAQDANFAPELFCAGVDEALYQYYETTVSIVGLGGNVNQYMYTACDPMQGVSVTIDVTEEIVCAGTDGAAVGFGFQLNAWSPANQKIAWQQYVLALIGGGLDKPAQWVAQINNWLADVSSGYQAALNGRTLLPVVLPGPSLPAGYQLRIMLFNDNELNIGAARFVIVDPAGNTLIDLPQTVLDVQPGLDKSDLAPIVAFTLNLVGPINGETAVLSAGAGTITYQALRLLDSTNNPLCMPKNPYVWSTDTGENANSSYAMPVKVSATTITQAFGVSGPIAPGPRRLTAARPPTTKLPPGLLRKLGIK